MQTGLRINSAWQLGFHPSTLYKCSGRDTIPQPLESCNLGGCLVNNDDDACSLDKCTCLGIGLAPVCGTLLPEACKADPNTIYRCPGGSGAKPEAMTVCFPGSECLRKPNPEGASCGINECLSPGDGYVCSSAFPERCNAQANSLYRCTQGGTPVLDEKGNYKKYCAFGMGGSELIDNSCECKDDGVACGDWFPPKCFLKSGSLYTCTKGRLPVVSKDCSPNKCGKAEIPFAGAVPLADVCLDACLCPTKRSVCFSTILAQLLYVK